MASDIPHEVLDTSNMFNKIVKDHGENTTSFFDNIPYGYFLTMDDVNDVTNNGKTIYIINIKSYKKVVKLDKGSDMVIDRSQDRTDSTTGEMRIGKFVSIHWQKFAGPEVWILINTEFSEYVRKINELFNNDINVLIDKLLKNHPPKYYDEDVYTAHNKKIINILDDVISKLKTNSENAKEIAVVFTKFSEDDEIEFMLPRFPESCHLTMKDVENVADHGKEMYVIEPQRYQNHYLLDSKDDKFSERDRDRIDEEGVRHIGHFFGLAGGKAFTDSAHSPWIVINHDFSDYVQKNVDKFTALAKIADKKTTLGEVAKDLIKKRFGKNTNSFDEHVPQKLVLFDMLNNGLKKLEVKKAV